MTHRPMHEEIVDRALEAAGCQRPELAEQLCAIAALKRLGTGHVLLWINQERDPDQISAFRFQEWIRTKGVQK